MLLKFINLINFKRYIFLLVSYNFISIIFLYDTTSFNIGLISVQGFLYCLNSYLFILFIIFETTSSFLDTYGLTFNFFKVVLTNPGNLNFDYIFLILLKNIKYVFFLFFNLVILKYRNNLLDKKKYYKKSFMYASLVLLIVIFSFNLTFITKFNNIFLKNVINKIQNKVRLFQDGKILRNDNWYLVLNSMIEYSPKNKNTPKFKFEKAFNKYKNVEDIYIIINESYPNFKDKHIKNNLTQSLIQNLNDVEISYYKKNWSKNYTTLGSELNFFCDNEKYFSEFYNLNKNNHLSVFFKNKNCWIDKLTDRYKIYIHSYDGGFFKRSIRYTTKLENEEIPFFKEVYFREELIKKNYNICEKNSLYIGVCENEIVDKLLNEIEEINKKKLIIYLTVENHIPIKIQDFKKISICNSRPLNLNNQFCTLYHMQINFNKKINNFINQLDKNDLLIFFSDTPPMFSVRDRIHFEDFIDVFFFKKK